MSDRESNALPSWNATDQRTPIHCGGPKPGPGGTDARVGKAWHETWRQCEETTDAGRRRAGIVAGLPPWMTQHDLDWEK